MRTLLWSAEAYSAIPGGHRVQLDKTAEALARLGVDVRTATGFDVALDGVDVVHGFGIAPEVVARCRVEGVRVVASTIYWSKHYVLGLHRSLPRRQRIARGTRLGWSIARHGREATRTRLQAPINAQRAAFQSVDLILPNSESEARAIRDELDVTTRAHVVPNGVDHRTFMPPRGSRERHGVLYAGRVEPHKNQLGLIKALRPTGVEVTIIGQPHPHHPQYYAACKQAGGPHTRFVGGISQAALVERYQRAAVHAMPSLFETTGLASLEAGLCGAAVVTTSRGYVRDYFEDLAHYCDPTSAESIRAAVAAALTTGESALLRQRILDRYTWDHAARATLDAYEFVLAQHRTGKENPASRRPLGR